MTNTDYLYALLSEGKLDLMYLPSGAVAWLFDRPDAQVKSAATLGMMAKDANPITGGSCLRADDNILILTCEGGQKFRIYPDGGVSVNGEVSDFTGCQQAMNTPQQPEMPQDECGPGCPCDDCQGEEAPGEFNNMAAPMEDHGDYSDEEMEEVARAQGTYEFANEADESDLAYLSRYSHRLDEDKLSYEELSSRLFGED